MLGQMTNGLRAVQDHPRLFRAMSFGDDDYSSCAAEVMSKIFEGSSADIDEVIDHFDVDIWYAQKHPGKAGALFHGLRGTSAISWTAGFLRVFVSHLSTSRAKVAALKRELCHVGISAFIAHEDVEPSREWQSEIEAALASMDVLVALVEPGFRESAWADQEIGFALGRGVDVIPLLVGQDPHGFIAKIQGVRVKGKLAGPVAKDLVHILLRKPRYRPKLLQGLALALAAAKGAERVARLRELEATLNAIELRDLLERSGLTDGDKESLADIIKRTGAFPAPVGTGGADDDLPF